MVIVYVDRWSLILQCTFSVKLDFQLRRCDDRWPSFQQYLLEDIHRLRDLQCTRDSSRILLFPGNRRPIVGR
jgi:hypothetical protein